MNQAKHPAKERVRQFMEQRRVEHRPPPSIKEIRRQLDWDLIDMCTILAAHLNLDLK